MAPLSAVSSSPLCWQCLSISLHLKGQGWAANNQHNWSGGEQERDGTTEITVDCSVTAESVLASLISTHFSGSFV